MNLLEFLGCLWLIMFLGYCFSQIGKEAGQSRRARSRHIKLTRGQITKFKGPAGPRPVTPDLTYICENCGMLIHTGHGHTREECENYNKERPFQPDHRCKSSVKESWPGRNDPKIRAPYYYEAGTFSNWGAGKEATTR